MEREGLWDHAPAVDDELVCSPWMELHQLRAFLAVLDTGSLQSGSKALNVSRTTVHAWISALEEHLQMELLVRNHRGVQATEFGRHFATGARALIEQADTLARIAARERDEVLGELRLCFSVGFPPQLLTHFPRAFRERYPQIELNLEISSVAPEDAPRDTDLIVHFAPRVPHGPFKTFVLARIVEHLVANRAYLDAHGRPETLEDLRQHQLLSWRAPGEDARAWPLRDGGTLEVAPYIITNDPYLLYLMVDAGQGIAFVPDGSGTGRGVPHGNAEIVLPDRVGRDSAVYVLVPEHQAATPRSRAAVRVLRELVKELLRCEMEEL